MFWPMTKKCLNTVENLRLLFLWAAAESLNYGTSRDGSRRLATKM